MPYDTRAPIATWLTTTTIGFDPKEGEPATIRLVLSDGIQRAMSAVVWDAANSVGDLGYDEAASEGGGAKFLWYYCANVGVSYVMTVVASDNPPSVGPAGRAGYKCVCVAYRDAGGNIVKQAQAGNVVKYVQRQRVVNLGIGTDANPVLADLSAFVPTTALAAELLVYAQADGNPLQFIVWVSGEQGAGTDNAQWYTRACIANFTLSSDGVHATVPIPGNKEIYYQRWPANSHAAIIDVLGYIDGSLEA